MYVLPSHIFSRAWINRLRLPILLVVIWKRETDFPCPRSRLGIRSRETGSAAPPRISLPILHNQAESNAYSRDSSRFPRRRPFIYTTIRDRVSPEFIRSRNCLPMASTAESPTAQGQKSPPVLSICPLHTDRGCGKERRIFIGPW